MSSPTTIYVSKGDLSSPYYDFFIDEEGNNKIQFPITLDANKTYIFKRLNQENSHPFYLSDSGAGNNSSSSISIVGDGSATSGIRGEETFTLTFNKEKTEISELIFYCTSHKSMQSDFLIKNWNWK